MKRIIAALLSGLCLLVGFVASPVTAFATTPDDALSAQNMRDILDAFVSAAPDRTTFGQGEELAAAYLSSQLRSLGYSVTTQEFTDGGTSANIIALKDTTRDRLGKVIIAAGYDNAHGAIEYDGFEYPAYGGDGALDNGTGVAVVLALAQALVGVPLDFDVEFVFFGASRLRLGSQYYFQQLDDSEIADILFMANFYRIGGDYLYLYTDEGVSQHERYLTGLVDGLSRMPAYRVFLPYVSSQRLSYSHYLLIGDHVPFFDGEVPIAHFYGGNLGTLSLADAESAKYPNISYTKDDTIAKLQQVCPAYADQMSTAARTIYLALIDPIFVGVLFDSRNATWDYSITGNATWANFALLVCAVVLVIVAFVLIRIFEHKYPPQRPALQPVFGAEYEPTSGENSLSD